MVFRATVPEAAVDEDRDLLLGENQIGLSTQVEFRPAVHAVPQTQGVHGRTKGKLAAGILPGLGPHPLPYLVIQSGRMAIGARH